MLFRADNKGAKVAPEVKPSIKDKYGYANVYLSFALGIQLRSHIRTIISLSDPKETLIISMGDTDLKPQLAALDKSIEKVYVLHSILDGEIDFVLGSAIPRNDTITGYDKSSGPIYNKERKETQDADIAAKKKLPVKELYEQAGKATLGWNISLCHRVCLLIDRKDKKIQYKDSFGRPIPEKLKNMLMQDLSIDAANIVCDTQKQQDPEDHCNCGFLSLENVLSLKNGHAYVDTSTDYIGTLEQLRNKYAEHVKADLQKFIEQNPIEEPVIDAETASVPVETPSMKMGMGKG